MANNVINSNHMQVEDWTNDTGSAVSSGDIIVVGAVGQAFIAVALVDIAAGAVGSVGHNCSVTAAKVSAAVFSHGEVLVWDSSASAFDDNQATPASGDVSTNAARATADGANGDTTAVVWLTGIPGTLTA